MAYAKKMPLRVTVKEIENIWKNLEKPSEKKTERNSIKL